MPSPDPADSTAAARRAAVVLAGGRSSRFGSDKTRAEVEGTPLLGLVLEAVRRVDPPVDEILVVGPWAPGGARHVVEPEPFGGPLAALAFALGEVSAPLVLVLAADHPELRPELLSLLLGRLAATGDADAVVPIREGRREPLVAAYRRDTVASITSRLIAEGRRSLQALLSEVELVELDEDTWRTLDPAGRSFDDVDRPSDLPDRAE